MAVQLEPESFAHRLKRLRSRYFPDRRSLLGLVMAFVIATGGFIGWYQNHQAVLASLTFGDLELGNMPQDEAIKQAKAYVTEKNQSEVEIIIRHRGGTGDEERFPKSLSELGFAYQLDERLEQSAVQHLAEGTTHGSATEAVHQLEGATAIQLVVDYGVWNSFVSRIKQHVERDEQEHGISWDDEKGWLEQPKIIGRDLDEELFERSFDRMTNQLLKYDHLDPELVVITAPIYPDMSEEEEAFQQQVIDDIRYLTEEPFVLDIAGEENVLDLNSDEDLVQITNSGVDLNESAIMDWLESLAEQYYRPTSTIRITGREEVRSGVYKALTEGEFLEGQKISPDEIYAQMIEALLGEGGERQRHLTILPEEIPLKVYSELEDMEYDLLSVGYSEYSTGNGANRVHNIKTGLRNINTSLIDAGSEISFNRLNGIIGSDFRVGYAIFGNEAKPSLGGGICQVSTTFYRALLNLGVPITQRQNHSWDLSYYQSGGYGLDATIYPPRGLDVKGVNDLPSQLFVYSYTRPDTEEAFVLIYGKGDGREVTLKPYQDYKPFYGAKTIKWTQRIEWPDGTVKENDIISRYRS